ncbi:uncharacterized protein SPSK_04696 [Sporothrix schenckii 1099-18]|uniref:Uncharacterized protein n=1 Tax=Sporothrix schenckii 1099-18 TaxID=1397361 RepID=A0A0F2M3J4_SPOSC|nr:uncharacterized protein SPSK_04696 [Sporothrix schenckii 1099-18]KJR83345.1 hypothetical protein SPSK_04696 [Sporothrix schenckii 1099-18]
MPPSTPGRPAVGSLHGSPTPPYTSQVTVSEAGQRARARPAVLRGRRRAPDRRDPRYVKTKRPVKRDTQTHLQVVVSVGREMQTSAAVVRSQVTTTIDVLSWEPASTAEL